MGGAVKAAKLTQRLLAFSRQQPSDARPIDVNQLVAEMSDLLHRTLGEAIMIEVALDAALWPIHAASIELEAAILNLAVNARDAMPAGGKLAITTRNVTFDEADAAMHADVANGSYVLIAVTDTGTGMSKDVIDRAFEPFFTTKAIGQGTGLGLCQVYNFVRQGGGFMNIYSEPGLGTTIKMYFPRWSGAEAETHLPPVAQSMPRGETSETILVVEDDPDVRGYSTATLRGLGYRVLEAPDGATALDIIAREPGLNLLFSDIGLTGGMDGRVLAKYAEQRRPGLKVLLTTAYPHIDLRRERQAGQPIELLPKPFAVAALASTIRRMLDVDPGARILVVDDEPLVRGTIVEMLTEMSCRVEEASTAQEARARLASQSRGSLDAALIDLYLPDGGGEALIAGLRATQPALPLILVVDDASYHLRERFADDKAVQILTKPFDIGSLRRVLETFALALRSPAGRQGE
jgi:CheY-like chemotaxis protein